VVFDLRVRRVRLDRLNTLLGAGLRLVALAAGDDLSVWGPQMEPELAALVLNISNLAATTSPLDRGLSGITVAQRGE